MTRRRNGVTVIELILVITIIGILGATVIPLGANFLQRNALRNKVAEIASSLRIAQLNSMSGKNGSQWGVNIGSGKVTLFEGSSYATRNAQFDQNFTIPSSVSVTSAEVVFSLITGVPDTTPTITISSSNESRSLTLNELGVVNEN